MVIEAAAVSDEELNNLLHLAGDLNDDEVELVEQWVQNADPDKVAALAIEVRRRGYRDHALVLCVALVRVYRLRHETLEAITLRPDDMTDFLDRYWSEGHVPVAKQIKLAFQSAFQRFTVEELKHYDKANPRVRVRGRNVCHQAYASGRPASEGMERMVGARTGKVIGNVGAGRDPPLQPLTFDFAALVARHPTRFCFASSTLPRPSPGARRMVKAV